MGTVLIVDDTETSATALELACAAIPGVETSFVPSAVDAIRMLESLDTICAVVTDVRMPAVDGFELIRFIRTYSRCRRMPVIVVSGDTDPETPERILKLGADAYFPKPFSPAAIRQKLEQLLHVNQDSE